MSAKFREFSGEFAFVKRLSRSNACILNEKYLPLNFALNFEKFSEQLYFRAKS